jgi:putative ABC transport system permease protein
MHDLRYAARILCRRPGSAIVAIATMALGIGATTILFSVAWNVLAKPLPWPEAERLVRISETRQGSTRRLPPILTNGTYLSWRDSPTTIEEIAGWSPQTMTVSLDAGAEPRRSRIVSMTASAFRLMRAPPVIGTLFGDADEQAADVAVISHGMWQQEFGGRSDVLGRSITLDGRRHSIVAVMPAAFAFPDRETRVWIPFLVRPVMGEDGKTRFISLFGAVARLKPGVTALQAAQEATARARNAPDPGMTAIAVFGSRGPADIAAVPVIEAMTADVRDGILVLVAAVALLLLTATANIASVQLARSTARRRDMAVRAALGAGSGRLAGLMLTESVLIGAVGGLLGLAVAIALQQTLPTLLPPDFPRVADIGLDWRVFAFAFTVSLGASLAFGLLPALQARRVDLVTALAQGGAPTAGTYGRTQTARIRTVIMAGQVAIACILIVGASLLVRSFRAMVAFDRGFDTANILTARVPLPDESFTAQRRAELVDRILQRLRSMPDVVSAAMTTVLPFGSADALMGFRLPPPRGSGDEPRQVQTAVRTVTSDYFKVVGMRINEGRGFAPTDSAAAPSILVVNREFARRYLDNKAPGTKLPLPLHDGRNEWEIVGVVDDARTRSVLEGAQPELFVCLCQLPSGLVGADPLIAVRTRADAARFAPSLRQVIREIDSSIALDAMLTMDQRLMGNLARPRLYAVVLAGFATFALLIAGVGLFGVLSYSVAQRAREIGVRSVLGARPTDIIGLVVREGLVITAAGLTVGMIVSALLARSMSAFLFGIVPHDTATFVAVPVVLLAVAALACAMPARRASRLDPLQVLKAP